ncbi:hypothetical protein R3P38DRAFT_3251966 [Favolaschia claudopus]|uniref:F-box domain-containing protein n=1 Tax=Favolaschia claudopus TaxID=2862362 RepID=A0AAW0E6U3_9AGAR
MSVFPQELYDLVISLITDTDSLASCSLVCRNWIPSTRINLFRRLRPLVISPSSLPQVLLLVDNSISTISPYISSLVLKDWSLTCSKSFYPLLPRIAGRMTAVESLVFYSCDWEEMSNGVFNFLVFYFRNTLKSLELRECPYRTFEGLLGLVCSFPMLETLSLHRLVVDRTALSPEPNARKNAPPPHLRSIHALGSVKSELMKWTLKSHLDIEEVSLGPILPGEARLVGKLLRGLKSTLKHLTLCGESVPNMHREISLKHNWQLTTIHFANLMLHPRNSDGMSWFIYLLYGIQGSSLRDLTFSVCPHSPRLENLGAIDWLALRTCLDRPQFMCLESVMFLFSMSEAGGVKWWDGYVENAEVFVRTRLDLPQFQDSGILGFDFGREVDAETEESDESD